MLRSAIIARSQGEVCADMGYIAAVLCIASDPHLIMYLRANVTVQQFDEFYETHGIQKGDGMHLREEDRIKVW